MFRDDSLAIRRAMSERDFWQGTPSELLALIGARKDGLAKDAIRLSTGVVKAQVANALKPYGLIVHRKCTPDKWLLQLEGSVEI